MPVRNSLFSRINMKFFVFAFVLAIFGAAFAYERMGYYEDPAHPGKCVYGDLVLSPGEEGKPKGECVRFICGKADGLSTVQGCGVLDVKPPCKLGDFIDVDAPYSKCCERHIICP